MLFGNSMLSGISVLSGILVLFGNSMDPNKVHTGKNRDSHSLKIRSRKLTKR